MRPFIVALLSVTLLAHTCGCSFLASSTQPLTVTCNDPEAELFIDGNPVGKGTVQVNVQRDAIHAVTAKSEKQTRTVFVGYKMSAVGILDIVGGCIWLLPFIGLAAPGSRQLERESVGVILK